MVQMGKASCRMAVGGMAEVAETRPQVPYIDPRNPATYDD